MAVSIKMPRSATPAKTAQSAAGKPSKKRAAKTKLISSKLAYKGRVFDVYVNTLQEPNGSIQKRDVIRHSGSVVILAIDESKNPADPEVILERQYRQAIGEFLLELPAGRVEPGESLLAAAKREMIEETGYRAKKWTPLTRYFASPGFLGEWMQIFLARDIREGVAKPEADEEIETLRIPLSEAMELVRSNKIRDGKSLVGLLLLDAARRDGRL